MSIPQLMAAKFHGVDSSEEAIREMFNISRLFEGRVIRNKLEIITKKLAGEIYNGPILYLELHSKFLVTDQEHLDSLLMIAKLTGSHTSQNSLKPGYCFITSRKENEHKEIVTRLKEKFGMSNKKSIQMEL